jgi:defect-in-organelle-trafficking protein DotC
MNAQLTPELRGRLQEPFKDLRQRAIHDASFALGAQLGLNWRFQQIWADLNQHAAYLDEVYNFEPLLLNADRVLPPVIVKADNTYQQSGDDQAQTTAVSYQILSPARVVSTAPNWRNYFPSPSAFSTSMMPDPSLLPKNDVERKIWSDAAQDGWNEGVSQANQIAEIDLNKLEQDFLGMIMFKKLSIQGMVSVPFLANGNLGIVVKGRSLSIDEMNFRLTGQPAFQAPQNWTPVATQEPDPPPPPAPPPAPVVSPPLFRFLAPVSVQLIAYGDLTNAQQYSAAFQSHYVPLIGQHTVKVVKSKDNSGLELYRVNVFGFAARQDAATWCSQAQAVGLTCEVR